MRRGAAIHPKGKRRDSLLAAIDAMIAEDFAGRVWPFDSAAAVAFAGIFAARRAAGQPISFADCHIGRLPYRRDREHPWCRPGYPQRERLGSSPFPQTLESSP